MRIYFNRRPKYGPYGGGAKIVNSLFEALQHDGHTVTHSLKNIDVYICFDPRPSDDLAGYHDILSHKNSNGGKIIQRVGDVGTHGKPELTHLVRSSIGLSDHVVYTSKWAKDFIDESSSIQKKNYSIIHNAPLKTFHAHKRNASRASLRMPARVVTHHWSDNLMKGFDALRCFDDAIRRGSIDAEFTYIGRAPAGFKLASKNSKHLSPMTAEQLAIELPKHDVYLTASKLEAGANHVLEAIAAGLPVMYHVEGGSIPEYCSGYGVKYTQSTTGQAMLDTLSEAFNATLTQFDMLKGAVMQYDRCIDDAIDEYKKIIYAA